MPPMTNNANWFETTKKETNLSNNKNKAVTVKFVIKEWISVFINVPEMVKSDSTSCVLNDT